MPKQQFDASSLAPLLDGSSAGELIPELARHGLQQLIELELAAFLGADWHERTEERLGHRNGYRPRTLTTQVGDLALQIPKLRSGSFLPSILEPRRRVDQALYAVIMEAYIAGVSTRKVDALVGALGSQSGISKSQVSRICQEIDQQVQSRGRARPPQEPRPVSRRRADGPNQLWSWDIERLPTGVRGVWLYLYLVVDVWSRKIVAWDVHDREEAELAADLISRACIRERISKRSQRQLILHADNGGAMRCSATLEVRLEELGVLRSFSRPRVSNDNPFSEALFARPNTGMTDA
jgi:hypothetical protein